MRLTQLQDFIAVAESGSIRAGARARGVSGPALTKSIRQLEEELHVPLLTRTTRGVVLSRYGDALLRRAQLIVSEARKASEELSQMLGARHGMVRIGATGGIARLLLPAVIKRFRQQHPDVQIWIDSGIYQAHVADLRAGVMDMAISPTPEDGIEPEFVCEHLYDNDSVVVAHKDHPLRNASTLGELAGSDWMLTGQSMDAHGSALGDAFRALGLAPPRVAIRCDTIGLIQALLEDRSLLCLLARQLVPGRLAAANLTALPIQDPLPSHAVSLIYRADSPMTPVAEEFSKLLRREVHYLSRMPDSPLRSRA
jgi:DNA-binding transcriptional LysR family regulator